MIFKFLSFLSTYCQYKGPKFFLTHSSCLHKISFYLEDIWIYASGNFTRIIMRFRNIIIKTKNNLECRKIFVFRLISFDKTYNTVKFCFYPRSKCKQININITDNLIKITKKNQNYLLYFWYFLVNFRLFFIKNPERGN